MTIADEKKQLRNTLKKRRAELSEDIREREQDGIDQQLLQLLDALDFEEPVFAAYMATADEVSCAMLVQSLWSQGRGVYLPRVHDKHQLTWHYITNRMQLHMGAYDILEPQTEPQALPEEIIILVPGVAFTKSGQRLGLGGGFYDAVLSDRSESMISIGLCWSCQLQDAIPSEAHDAKVDGLLCADQAFGRAEELLR